MGIEINYLAVLVAAVIYYIGGAFWYSPVLFGKSWMGLVGLNRDKMEAEKKDAWQAYLIALIAAFFVSYGLARVEVYMNVITIGGGLHTGFWAWFCFVLTTMATNNFFAGKPPKLLIIDGGFHLYGFLVIGMIHAIWK